MANSTAEMIREVSSAMASGAGVEPTPTSDGAPSEGVTVVDDGRDGENDGTVIYASEVDGNTEQQPLNEAPAADNKKVAPVAGKEVITVTDADGKRKKVEIDLSDTAKVRKAFEMSYGARKWQAERDNARAELAKERESIRKLQDNWNALDRVWKERGEEGVLDLLAGEAGASKKFIQKHMEKQKFLENASPDELEVYKAREQAAHHQRELDRIRKENEEFRNSVTKEREEAEYRAAEAKVHPVFDRYSFTDKLGDAQDEHLFNTMLWNTSMSRLEDYEKQNIPVTQELIEKEFRTVATTLKKRIGNQAEKKAQKVVAQKTVEATENAQAAVRNGYKDSSTRQEADKLLSTGNISGLLRGWKKYQNSF